jgi:sulfate permease, SulP family
VTSVTTPGDDASPFRPREQEPLVQRTFPVSEHLPGYPRRRLRGDTVAAITVAALALPAGMAYAQLAGLSPVAGLYALLLPAIAYMVFGSSRQMIVGPEGALAVLVATSVAPIAGQDAEKFATLAALLAVLVAAVYAVGRLVRIGWIADYFSRSVLVGYIHGVAVVLIINQIGKLFGLSLDKEDPLPKLAEFFREVDTSSATTVTVAAVSLAVLLLMRWRAPRVPGPLVVVVGGIVASYVLDLSDHGVAVVGEIPAGLPNLSWPSATLGDVAHLVPAAVGIFAVGYADAVLVARSFAGRRGQHIDANQELVALGTANLAAGLTQAFPVGASGSRTAVNDQMGGKTQFVGLFSAAVIAVVLLFLTAPVERLPSACLGAIIVSAGLSLIEPAAWRALALVGRSQVVIAGVACAGVIVLGVLRALILAVGLSIVETVSRSTKPHDAVLGWVPRLNRYADVAVHSTAQVVPGVVVYRLDDRLIFANARYFKGRVGEAIAGAATTTRWCVLDAEGVTSIDASGVEALEQLHATLHKQEIKLAVARLKTPMRERFDITGITQLIGEQNFHPTVRAAVDAARASDPAPGADEQDQR